MSHSSIHIEGARQHNLKNLSLDIPRDELVVVCGPSGSGKSTLAFDIVYAEGQRRYVESLSAYARQFLPQMDKPDVDKIEGLSPAISLEQPPKRLDATDGMAVALCHHFTISNPLNAAMGNERVKGLGGGKKAVSKGGSQSWEKFLREHPDREIK